MQIVDARNPLLFRAVDLERYVASFTPPKRSLLLVNKADLLTEAQRRAWARYFRAQGITHLFFSAQTEMARQKQSEAVEAKAPHDERRSDGTDDEESDADESEEEEKAEKAESTAETEKETEKDIASAPESDEARGPQPQSHVAEEKIGDHEAAERPLSDDEKGAHVSLPRRVVRSRCRSDRGAHM